MYERVAAENSLVDYLRVIWRRRWLVLACPLVAFAVSQYITSTTTPLYSASSRILLAASDSEVFATSNNAAADPLQVETAVQLMKSSAITAEVVEKLGRAGGQLRSVSPTPIAGTRIITIKVRATTPNTAAEAATLYATVFRDNRRDKAIETALSLGQKLAESTAEARTQLDEAEQRLADAVATKQSVAEQQSLRQQRDAAAANFLSVQQKSSQANIDAAVRTGGTEVLEEGVGSSTPVNRDRTRSGALAIALGLMLGVVAALALDFLDDSLRSVEEIERRTHGVPNLVAIPAIAEWRDTSTPHLVTVEEPHSPASEAYRSLRTSVQLLEVAQDKPIIQVSSPVAGEGKTTTVANLAVAFAMSNRVVSLVDCDLRRPRLHEFMGLSNDQGLTSVLAGDVALHRAVRHVKLPNGYTVQVLTAGFPAANPAELLGTSRFRAVLKTLQEESDVVLIDGPPVLPVTDAVVLSSHVDCVLLVATIGNTSRRHLTAAVSTFKKANAPLSGIVTNRGPSDSSYGYGYTYS